MHKICKCHNTCSDIYITYFLLFDYFSENFEKKGDAVKSIPVREGTEFADAISVLRTFQHPLYIRLPDVTYYYDIAIMELGMC